MSCMATMFFSQSVNPCAEFAPRLQTVSCLALRIPAVATSKLAPRHSVVPEEDLLRFRHRLQARGWPLDYTISKTDEYLMQLAAHNDNSLRYLHRQKFRSRTRKPDQRTFFRVQFRKHADARRISELLSRHRHVMPQIEPKVARRLSISTSRSRYKDAWLTHL